MDWAAALDSTAMGVSLPTLLILRPTAVVLSIYDSTEDKKPLVSETAELPKSVLMNPLNFVIHKWCLAIDLSIWLAAVGVGWGTLG